jgi:type IV pilus assembly protein PilB
MRIGDLLIVNGMITEEKLNEVLKMQIYTKKKLGELLVEQGVLTERMLGEILEFHLGFPMVNLSELPIQLEALKLISESIARKHKVLPISINEGKLHLVMADPLNYDAIEEVSIISGRQVQPMIGIGSEIDSAINRYYSQDAVNEIIEDMGGNLTSNAILDIQDSTEQAAPIIKLVHQLIQTAIQLKASDIHIDPQEKQVAIRYRIDGILRTEKVLPKTMQNVVLSRVKIIAKLDIAERRLPQDGRIQVQIEHRKIDIRVSTLPTVYGEGVVLRILDQSQGLKPITSLGFNPNNQVAFERMLRKPNGIILISGPTGSGKTSTLYSSLQWLNQEDSKIITIEDPVEYPMNGVSQVQVNAKIGLTFASGLRSILRQDPNIVMVGEIRDTETAEIAIRASMTGHLVLSTIHTNSAVSTISRLIDMGIDPYLIASSLTSVVAQRLVRKVCVDCAKTRDPTDYELSVLKAQALKLTQVQFASGSGCSSCGRTGFRGRMAIQEVLVIDEPLRRLIAQNRSIDDMHNYLIDTGYTNLFKDGLYKSAAGQTTIEELLKVVAE